MRRTFSRRRAANDLDDSADDLGSFLAAQQARIRTRLRNHEVDTRNRRYAAYRERITARVSLWGALQREDKFEAITLLQDTLQDFTFTGQVVHWHGPKSHPGPHEWDLEVRR